MQESYTATPRLLYVAMQLFMKQGYEATSVDQICRMTGISKGGFFHHYKSKLEIAIAAVDYYWELLDEYLFTGLDLFDAEQRLEKLLERMAGLPEHLHFMEGSLFSVLTLELARTEVEMKFKLNYSYGLWSSKLATVLFDNGMNTEKSTELARQWIAIYEGAVLQAKSSGDKNRVREQLKLFEEFLYAIFIDKTKKTQKGKRS